MYLAPTANAPPRRGRRLRRAPIDARRAATAPIIARSPRRRRAAETRKTPLKRIFLACVATAYASRRVACAGLLRTEYYLGRADHETCTLPTATSIDRVRRCHPRRRRRRQKLGAATAQRDVRSSPAPAAVAGMAGCGERLWLVGLARVTRGRQRED